MRMTKQASTPRRLAVKSVAVPRLKVYVDTCQKPSNCH